MRHWASVSAGLVLWALAAVIAASTITGVLDAGDYLLAALAFALALGALTAGAVMTLLPLLED